MTITKSSCGKQVINPSSTPKVLRNVDQFVNHAKSTLTLDKFNTVIARGMELKTELQKARLKDPNEVVNYLAHAINKNRSSSPLLLYNLIITPSLELQFVVRLERRKRATSSTSNPIQAHKGV
jgi:hypothetical protein